MANSVIVGPDGQELRSVTHEPPLEVFVIVDRGGPIAVCESEEQVRGVLLDADKGKGTRVFKVPIRRIS